MENINKINEEKELVYNLKRSKLPVSSQVASFIEKTGKSRATFYRIKKTIDEEDEIDKQQEEISNSHQNNISRSSIDSEKITVDHFLDKIRKPDLEIKKIDRDYFCISIKNNGFILNYVKKTAYGIVVQYHNDRAWKPERIQTQDQLDAVINKTNDFISKSIQEQKNLAIPEGLLKAYISHLKRSEPMLKIKKMSGKRGGYNIFLDNIIIAELLQRKNGKLTLNWVISTELKGTIINGEKDFHKATHRIKDFIDIYKKRNDINKWMSTEGVNNKSEDIDKTENIENQNHLKN